MAREINEIANSSVRDPVSNSSDKGGWRRRGGRGRRKSVQTVELGSCYKGTLSGVQALPARPPPQRPCATVRGREARKRTDSGAPGPGGPVARVRRDCNQGRQGRSCPG